MSRPLDGCQENPYLWTLKTGLENRGEVDQQHRASPHLIMG